MGLNFLKCLINVFILSHLLLHLDSHEIIPQLIDIKIASHFVSILILTLVGGTLSNLLVPLLSVNSSLNRLFLVGNTFLKLEDSASSILLLLLNVLHQLVEGVLRLESFLLSASLLSFLNN